MLGGAAGHADEGCKEREIGQSQGTAGLEHSSRYPPGTFRVCRDVQGEQSSSVRRCSGRVDEGFEEPRNRSKPRRRGSLTRLWTSLWDFEAVKTCVG